MLSWHRIQPPYRRYRRGVLRGVAGASRVTAPRALVLSHTPKKPHAQADPPPTDPADEQAPGAGGPRADGVRRRAGARAGSVPTQAGGKGGVRARGSGK